MLTSPSQLVSCFKSITDNDIVSSSADLAQLNKLDNLYIPGIRKNGKVS